MDGVDVAAHSLVLPADDLRQALGLHDAERGRELVHAEVEAVDAVVGLAVVPERPREVERLLVARDQHAALAGGDRLRRGERPYADVAERPGAAAVPLGAVRVRAVLD